MTPSDLQTPRGIPSLVNLDSIEHNRRAAAWHSGARTYFPGMSVRDLEVTPAIGAIAGSKFGAGRLWTILSPPLQVNYDPTGASDRGAELFSLMLQLGGSTLTRQG